MTLGTMTFGSAWGWGVAEAEARSIVDCYSDAGGNFIDTANSYMNGESEVMVGRCLAGRRDRFIVSTKASASLDPKDPNSGGNHRKCITRSLEASLKRLGTDYVDLLYLHMWDGHTQANEVCHTMADLIQQGKILHAGVSNVPAWKVAQLQTASQFMNIPSFVALQVVYSLLYRDIEREFLTMASDLNLAVCPWAPLGAGLLAGGYASCSAQNGDSPPPFDGTRRRQNIQLGLVSEENLAIAKTVASVASELGLSSAQVALRWVLGKGTCSPVVGARTIAQLKDNLGALEEELPTEQMALLDKVSSIPMGYPHDFLIATRRLVDGEATVRR